MMDWIHSFLKKHQHLQAFDNAWKTLPRTLGFSFLKKPTMILCSGKEKREGILDIVF